MSNDIWATTRPQDLDESRPALRSPLLEAKVMMLDDEPLMTDLLQTYLEDAGYVNFVVANDPLQALEMLRREKPSVLLLDLMMPKLSGFELLEEIRADRELRYTPVIVLTASSGADAKLQALRLGATDFLAKPVDASELVLRVRNTLAFQQYHDRISHYDTATSLPNERLFRRELNEFLLGRSLVGDMVALFTITLLDCRYVRDAIDQNTADALAGVFARRLDRFAHRGNGANRPGQSPARMPRLARLGIDQFAVSIEGLAGPEAAEACAKTLLDELSQPVIVGAHEIAPSPWIGIALAPTDGDNVDDLRKGADLAASHARAMGAVHFAFASAELNSRVHERLLLGGQLRGAAQRGELVLHYQPKIAATSGRIVGAEALVRWNHPQRGLLLPAMFIQVAEEFDAMGLIGDWVMARAARDGAEWARAGLGELKIAVNVSKQQFASADLCLTVRNALTNGGLAPHQLTVELTESILMDNVTLGLALMHELKALGVTLSIDDFGTGYSSLSYLKKFPLDELKVDRSFVVDLPGQPADMAIVRSIIDLGHNLGMTVTAEGIETEAQRDALRELRCDQFQGFLFSPAISAADFSALLAGQRVAD
jgi:diguanylate cyclase